MHFPCTLCRHPWLPVLKPWIRHHGSIAVVGLTTLVCSNTSALTMSVAGSYWQCRRITLRLDLASNAEDVTIRQSDVNLCCSISPRIGCLQERLGESVGLSVICTAIAELIIILSSGSATCFPETKPNCSASGLNNDLCGDWMVMAPVI